MTVDTKTLKTVEDKLIFAERLASIMQDSFTKKEFVDAFEKVINVFLALKEQNKSEITSFREEYDEAKKMMGKEHHHAMEKLESKIDASLSEKSALIDGRLSQIKDGETPTDEELLALIKPLVPELPAIPEVPNVKPIEADIGFLMDEIKRLKEELQRIEQIRGRVLGGGGTSAIGVASAIGFALRTEVPTGDIDGVNLIYTVTKPINAVFSFGINGQMIHANEYSFIGRTITFTTAFPADLSGTRFEIKFI